MTAEGIINLSSKYPVTETANRLEAVLHSKGIKIFLRIDQAEEADSVGLSMRPTELLIFGDPKAGTPLMNAYPTLAMDLPLKALIWESEDGATWLSYNSPEFFQQRHHLDILPFSALGALFQEATE
ncbi:MAG: DUF302 domain-containing protein [Chthoniobacterales bacterium]